MASNAGVVKIHGREYQTVAYRVQTFREQNPNWTIQTELVHRDDDFVVMKAFISDAEGRVIGTGYAEENRLSSQINRTSALENCETSAIGRALAACGWGGTEYATANEVENAIHQQRPEAPKIDEKMKREYVAGIQAAIHNEDPDGLRELMDELREDQEMKLAVWNGLNSRERRYIKDFERES